MRHPRSNSAREQRPSKEASIRTQKGKNIAYQDVLGVRNGSDDSCGDHELLPGLGEVDDVNSFDISFVNVWLQQV